MSYNYEDGYNHPLKETEKNNNIQLHSHTEIPRDTINAQSKNSQSTKHLFKLMQYNPHELVMSEHDIF